jgi:hypothetical protein
MFFLGVPHFATCIFLFFYNEPELGVGINPGMALTPLPSSIGRDRVPSALPLDHSFCLMFKSFYKTIQLIRPTFQIIGHWRHCNNSECRVCKPFRQATDMSSMDNIPKSTLSPIFQSCKTQQQTTGLYFT